MTSLGRLIFFDQPGTGASDPVTPGALPTLEQWADSITAVLDDLGSREAVLVASARAFATAALFAATHPSRTTALVVLEGFADAGGTVYSFPTKPKLRWSACGAAGSSNMCSIRTCRGTRRSGQRGLEWNACGEPADRASMLPLRPELDVRAVLPTVRVPTLVVQHSDDPIIPPAQGKYIAEHIPGRNTSNCRGATGTTSSNRGRRRFTRSPSSSPVTRPTWPMIGFWPRCCSPTLWTRRAGPRRSATVTGMRCWMLTTPSSGHSSLGFEGAR